MATKICRTCGIEKDICEFIPKRNHCKVCIKARKKEYYVANSEKIKAHKKEYCVANPEKIKAYSKKYYVANPEKIKAREDERSKRIWIKRCIQERVITEQEAIIQHEIMQVGRAAIRQQTETKNELMTMGIF